MRSSSLPSRTRAREMFTEAEREGVVFLVSDKLKSRHAFSTRIGGVSREEYTSSLNLAYGRGDSEAMVRENYEIFACAVGFDADKLISVPQIHSSDVRFVADKEAGAGVSKSADFSCDGYVSATDGLPIGVKTADCVPILLEARDDDGNVIAVSAVHAGWRGTADRIAAEAVEKLVSLDAKKENIYAAIGPSIHRCCYEIGNDFASAIGEKLGQSYENKFISMGSDGKLYADVSGMDVELLLDMGIPRDNIDICDMCTHCRGELFYSHRRQKGKRGAMLNVIIK